MIPAFSNPQHNPVSRIILDQLHFEEKENVTCVTQRCRDAWLEVREPEREKERNICYQSRLLWLPFASCRSFVFATFRHIKYFCERHFLITRARMCDWSPAARLFDAEYCSDVDTRWMTDKKIGIILKQHLETKNPDMSIRNVTLTSEITNCRRAKIRSFEESDARFDLTLSNGKKSSSWTLVHNKNSFGVSVWINWIFIAKIGKDKHC